MPLTNTLVDVHGYSAVKKDTIDVFRYYQEIEKHTGAIDDIVNWCKSEISTEWRWQLLEVSSNTKPGKYRFFFETENDYCSFLLKWG